MDPGTYLACMVSASPPENPREYTKYSLRFSDNLTKTLTARAAHPDHTAKPSIYTVILPYIGGGCYGEFVDFAPKNEKILRKRENET